MHPVLLVTTNNWEKLKQQQALAQRLERLLLPRPQLLPKFFLPRIVIELRVNLK